MVNPDRSRLSGTVEVDETWIGGKQAGLKGGRQRKGRKAIEVVVAVERREKSLGRLRLEIVGDDGSETLYDFIRRNVEPGSLIVSDAWPGYSGIEPEIYDHQSVSQAAQKRLGGSPSAVPGVDRVTSNLKTWLRGTHHGVGADHLDAYLDEFVFRFNRRCYPMSGFATLLGLGTGQPPTTGDQILSPLTPERAVRRRGRATASRRCGSRTRRCPWRQEQMGNCLAPSCRVRLTDAPLSVVKIASFGVTRRNTPVSPSSPLPPPAAASQNEPSTSIGPRTPQCGIV
jgi:hypothetical protein